VPENSIDFASLPVEGLSPIFTPAESASSMSNPPALSGKTIFPPVALACSASQTDVSWALAVAKRHASAPLNRREGKFIKEDKVNFGFYYKATAKPSNLSTFCGTIMQWQVHYFVLRIVAFQLDRR
jgi:hypothetical protein